MKTQTRSTLTPVLQTRAVPLSLDDTDLPPGVCGRVRGIALPFEVVDSYGTLFRAGCTDKTRNKAAKRKIKLFDNHGMADWYGTRTHVGTVRSLALSASGNADEMVADLLDTEDGRRCHEYLRAVLASGGETGLSVGFYPRESHIETIEGRRVEVFTEIEIDEISLAPRNAVPGADVLGVRADLSDEQRRAMLRHLARGLTRTQWITLTMSIVTAPDDESDDDEGDAMDDESTRSAAATEDDSGVVSLDERVAVARRLIAHRYL